ncbi:MAG: AMP-binding protein [Lachnospiraceae bacterium]
MKNILEYLENTERKYPYRLAADDGKICVTWSTLVALSRQMGTVIGRKVPSGSPVVILAEKSVITLTAMLGCVYAGGFYVMADPSLPAARLQEIFRQVQPELVVVEPSAHPLSCGRRDMGELTVLSMKRYSRRRTTSFWKRGEEKAAKTICCTFCLPRAPQANPKGLR